MGLLHLRSVDLRELFAAATLAVLLAACGDVRATNTAAPRDSQTPVANEPEEEDHEGPDVPGAPPPVTVAFGDDSIELDAWTYCYDTGCVDGAPPRNLPDVGSPEEVTVEFPLDGWRFDAFLEPPGDECGREFRTSLEEIDDGIFLLRPVGYAGTYDVTLMGRGGGDLFVTFTWTTPHDGRLPQPKARLAIVADHDGEPDSYGIELELKDLAATPKQAQATITVTAADGDALTFEAERDPRQGCRPDGMVYWDRPDDEGLQAAALGEAPFTYEVELTLDGERYRATAVWPDDQIEGNEPSVRLEFSPPLPALS